jgi:glycosyltransferase involved in cell wall biosynthesis
MNFITFIIPSVGRDTLGRTLASVLAQTESDWNAIVVGDGLPKFSLPAKDTRLRTLGLQEKVGEGHHSGAVRNFGLAAASSRWIGFVDDDDRLDTRYLQWLKAEADGQDLIVFRMKYSPPRDDAVVLLPRSNAVGSLGPGEVGISFAVRTEFQREADIWFDTEEFEDWHFIRRCLANGARCKVSDRTAYYIRH